MGSESNKKQNLHFLAHLAEKQLSGLLRHEESVGNIVFADDQFVNQQFMQMSFLDLGLASKLIIFSNGSEVVNYFTNLLDQPVVSQMKQPISLLILDINMPGLNGLECAANIKKQYKEINQRFKGK